MALFEWLICTFIFLLFKLKIVMNASTPTQPPTTANNTINAEGDLPSDALIPVLPPFAARAVKAEDNLPACSKDIIVGGYHIDGVANIIGEESRRHVVVFYEATIPILEKKSESNQLMNKSKFDVIKEGLLRIREGDESISQLRIEYPSIYKWNKAVALVVNGDSIVLIARPPDIVGQQDIDVNFVKRITYFEHAFSNIRRAHGQDHTKGRTFYGRVCKRVENIGRNICKMFTNLCPICIQRQLRNRPIAGLRPIVTHGFGTRGQIDLIDFQSMPDGSFRFLLNYIDHGVKFLFSIPIVHKTASCIAIALLQIFTMIGPPMILQSDNGAEFHGAAMNDRQRKLYGSLVTLTKNDLAAIITEMKQMWPKCRMVRGSPRHFQSNGGVERVNCTMESKLDV